MDEKDYLEEVEVEETKDQGQEDEKDNDYGMAVFFVTGRRVRWES